MESKEAQLGCDVDGPLIMAAAAAAFVLWKLNLEVEGSLPLSQAVFCTMQINAAEAEVLHQNSKSKWWLL